LLSLLLSFMLQLTKSSMGRHLLVVVLSRVDSVIAITHRGHQWKLHPERSCLTLFNWFDYLHTVFSEGEERRLVSVLKGVHEVSERSLEVSLAALCSHAVRLNMVSMGLQSTDLKFIFIFLNACMQASDVTLEII